jgi:small subunit ribosomal protein S1
MSEEEKKVLGEAEKSEVQQPEVREEPSEEVTAQESAPAESEAEEAIEVVEEAPVEEVEVVAEAPVAEVIEETPVAVEVVIEEVIEETPVAVEVVIAEVIEETPVAVEEVVAEAAPEAPASEVVAPVEEVVAEVKAEKIAEPIAEPIDIWDTSADDGFGEEYSAADRKRMEDMYISTMNSITEKEVMSGTIVGITDRDVIVNIGFKSDGLVPLSEFRDLENLKRGDKVDVFVEEQENANGQLVLSRRKAKIVKAWENIQNGLDNDEVIEGMVKRRTKGGLIVDVYGVEAFLPGSQIDVKPIRDFDVFVGKKMEVKVVKINYTNDNVVVSHKVLIEKDIEKQKAVILNNLEKGQVLEGVIKNMTNFGVFIDLGGVDGLLHITDISWGRINHPEEVLNLDEKVNVVVLDFDDDKKRISLGMKQLTAHPWDSLDPEIIIGSKVKGKIVNVADYGAFLEIIPGVEGLIHVSEMSWSQHLRNPQDFMNVKDLLEAVVLTIDRDDRKMSLGIKQLSEDPWTKQDLLTKYGVGTRHSGIIRNLTNFGLFIELEEGIDGLVHVSDLSWTKKVKHPSEFVKVGETLEVVVMELDGANRRLALSHKHLEENPWDTFETVFTKGSIHKCTVVSKNDKGAQIELPYGLEGQVANKNLQKEDETFASDGETLDFKVLEFSKDEKRIVLSHTSIWKETAEQPVIATAKQAKSGSKPNTLDKINKESEKSTLGDLEALSALKDKMDEAAKPAPVKVVAAKKAAKVEPVIDEDEVAPKKKAVSKSKKVDNTEED